MPLPPKLRRGAPKEKVKAREQEVMHELKHGKVTSPARKATSGVQRHKQDVAIMLKNVGKSKETSEQAPVKPKRNAGPVQPMHKRHKKNKPV